MVTMYDPLLLSQRNSQKMVLEISFLHPIQEVTDRTDSWRNIREAKTSAVFWNCFFTHSCF
jgi:hypothetical protein